MTLSEFAEILRSGHRAPIVEADEWRPLAQYVLHLLKMQREACAQTAERASHSMTKTEEQPHILGVLVRETPLVADKEST